MRAANFAHQVAWVDVNDCSAADGSTSLRVGSINKKLGRIVRPSRRLMGNRRDIADGAGCAFLFVAIDDHARIGFTDMYPDEGKVSAVQFLRHAVAYYRSLGVQVKGLLTDDGSAFRSNDFAQACRDLSIKHRFLALSPAN